ncbi:ABC transporter ATP-binding protein [Consotaella aegiceratis]|uniref:ABC transporter ATP-binding protein n=1 Tax=Consotaella aegiceratis TaxID=3097961 RepID=UPI002F42FB9A
MYSLELQHVQKNYRAFQALSDINLTVDKGEFIVMVGPSGCGKSTLLKSIAGLEALSGGKILIDGRDVTGEEPSERGIAMVFQSYALYPHMSVAENMGFGLRMAKRPKAEINAAVTRAAHILRLTDQLDKLPKQLSGGQRQRVAIGRAITRSPSVFLFDEPLSNLDAALRTQMRVELAQLHAELGSTMIYVTHDQVEAMTLASRIVVLNAGRVEQVGTPGELYSRPCNRFVAGFLGAPRMNFFESDIECSDEGRAIVRLPGMEPFERQLSTASSASGKATIGVRPEAFHIQANVNDVRVPGVVRLVEELGRETILYVDASPLRTFDSDTGTHNIAVHLGESRPFTPGTNVELGFDPAHVHVFAGPGELSQT